MPAHEIIASARSVEGPTVAIYQAVSFDGRDYFRSRPVLSATPNPSDICHSSDVLLTALVSSSNARAGSCAATDGGLCAQLG